MSEKPDDEIEVHRMDDDGGPPPDVRRDSVCTPTAKHNATFWTFKPSGKWKYHGRGCVSRNAFNPMFDNRQRREFIVKENDGKMPGCSSGVVDLFATVVLDDDVDYGWPLMLLPLVPWE